MHFRNFWTTNTMPIVPIHNSVESFMQTETMFRIMLGVTTVQIWCVRLGTHADFGDIHAHTHTQFYFPYSLVLLPKSTWIVNPPVLDAVLCEIQCVHIFMWLFMNATASLFIRYHTWRPRQRRTTYHIALIQICVMNNSIETTWWLHLMTFGFSEIRLLHATAKAATIIMHNKDCEFTTCMAQ